MNLKEGLEDVLTEINKRKLARDAGINRGAVYNILAKGRCELMILQSIGYAVRRIPVRFFRDENGAPIGWESREFLSDEGVGMYLKKAFVMRRKELGLSVKALCGQGSISRSTYYK